MGDSEKESQQINVSRERRPVVIVEDLPKHLRRRYWSSWEELKLVELWRRYYNDITTLLRNMPVFTSISGDMRSYGFQVNPQECRRKINNLKNKYIAERRKLDISGDSEAESEWRLFPLIHCILNQENQKMDKYHERNIVKELLSKLPPLPSKPQPPTKSIALGIQNEVAKKPQQQKQQNGFPKPITIPTPKTTPNAQTSMRPPYKRAYRTSSSISVTSSRFNTLSTPTTTRVLPFKSAKNCTDHRLLRHHLSLPRLQELQQDNLRLAERRDFALKRLCIEEREVKMLEQVVDTLQCGGD